eukprot:3481264-Amphidinium_carterae.1
MRHQDLYGSCKTLCRSISLAVGSSGLRWTFTSTSCSSACSPPSGEAEVPPTPRVSSFASAFSVSKG